MNATLLAAECEARTDLSTLEYLLLGDLRELLHCPRELRDPHWLTVTLDALLQTFPRELDGGETGGYLTEILAEHPYWHRAVADLARERAALFSKLWRLSWQLATEADSQPLDDEVLCGLRDWMLRLRAHRRRERRLLQLAVSWDIGGEG